MLHLNSEETYLSHSDGLNQFIESQIEYYQNCLNISQELKAQMSGDSKPQSLLRVPTAGAMPRSASENCISSTTRSTPPEDVVRRSFMASSISADPQAGRVHVMPTGESITSRQPLAKSMTTSNILQLPQSNSTISMPVPASSPDRLVKVLFDFDGETEKELSCNIA